MGSTRKQVVAIAGATGYIGRELCRVLKDAYHVVGLTRRSKARSDVDGIEWRNCDLFSSLECERALEGVDTAVYLVHSMIPSARLTQGSFMDMDLILADNFARAAQHRSVKRIVYLGGIIPDVPPQKLSRHLRSRLEVENTLGSKGASLTVFRASIVIGAHGSSFAIFRTLISRMPIIPCPVWGRSLTQPIALGDLLDLFVYALRNPHKTVGTFDVGSPDVISYRVLLQKTAVQMRKKRWFFDVPIRGMGFCKMWMRLVTGAPLALISPLVESMSVDMVAGNCRLQRQAGIPGMPLSQAIDRALAQEKRQPERMDGVHEAEPEHFDVRSVQRLPLPPGFRAREVVARYLRWQPWIFRWCIVCTGEARDTIRLELRLLWLRKLLVELKYSTDRNVSDDRQVYFIHAGLLVRRVERESRKPRLEFREVLGGRALLMAIHNYFPALPSWLYRYTQAKAHLFTARSFARHLSKMGEN